MSYPLWGMNSKYPLQRMKSSYPLQGIRAFWVVQRNAESAWGSRSVPPPKRGSFGRDPAGTPRRQTLDGASRHAAPDRPGAQAPCSVLSGWPSRRSAGASVSPQAASDFVSNGNWLLRSYQCAGRDEPPQGTTGPHDFFGGRAKKIVTPIAAVRSRLGAIP
jgi:hypothetical protein